MAPLLFFLFIAIPILEIAVMIQVGSVLGLFPTILLMIITAALGASLVKNQGIQMVWNIKSRLQQGILPDTHIAEGILLAIAGVLLITPGFLTDTLGLVFLTPVSRIWIAQHLMRYLKVRVLHQGTSYEQHPFDSKASSSKRTPHSKGQTIDAEFTRKDD
tara:strand:+ start:5436 stop:5915 length:480 start_codon:yes stop_codon:yes gene_type:complete